ncbi:MAG: hypothetical protein L0J79_01010, partial [Propionibacterium sp.]|nr:hypothetical protein [Propionibacterium sp.]
MIFHNLPFLAAEATTPVATTQATGAASLAWLMIAIPMACAVLLLLLGRAPGPGGARRPGRANGGGRVVGRGRPGPKGGVAPP